jgi:hypothetical protein
MGACMPEIETAKRQFLHVLENCKYLSDISFECIRKLLRGEYVGAISDAYPGDFYGTIARHEELAHDKAIMWVQGLVVNFSEKNGLPPSALYDFLTGVHLGDTPNHMGEGHLETKSATLLHDWYSEAIQSRLPQASYDDSSFDRRIA